MAEAREERKESSNAPIVELDDLDDRSTERLVRLRRWRVIRLVSSIVAVPVGWSLALHLPGALPVFALALSAAGALNALLSVYLIVHVQSALAASRYEDSFKPSAS